MKLFSAGWKSSSKVSKQRKYRLNSALHLKRNFLAAPLAPDLKARYDTRSLTVREGDTVKIMKGEFKGVTGKINSVNLRKSTVYVDGAGRVRKDGTKSFFPLRPSGLMLVEISVEDKKRAASLARKNPGNKKPAKGK
ncbi:50S ribosomal protein L24 [Candidatus Woesearchaeota archaeon]|nr:50S ribosomal protein L24 [Candidatus Woesearchaeota archaeon]